MKLFYEVGLMIALGMLLIQVPPAGAMWYGEKMHPTYSSWNVAEMPTGGLIWTTPPSGQAVSFWVGDTDQAGDFEQLGYSYNGLNIGLCEPHGTHCQGPNSWAMIWSYCLTCQNAQVYYGDDFQPGCNPFWACWQHTDHIYFSMAIYPTKHEFVFRVYDSNNYQQYQNVAICGVSISNNAAFTGPVGVIAETGSTNNQLGNIAIDQAAVWAESTSLNQRVSSTTYSDQEQGNPTPGLLTYIYANNDVQIGWNMGSYWPNGLLMWSNTYTSGLEQVPPDMC